MLTTVLLSPFTYFGRVFSGLGYDSNWPALCMGIILLTITGGALMGVRYKLLSISHNPAEARQILIMPISIFVVIMLMFSIVYTAAFSMEYMLYTVLPAFILYAATGFTGGYIAIWNINKKPKEAIENTPKKKWD